MKKSKIKNLHKQEFYEKQYEKYNQAMEDKGLDSMFKSVDAFAASYEALRKDGEKNITKQLIYSTQYGTDYDTALAEYKMAKKVGIKITLKEAKELTTQEFADLHKSEILHAYKSYLKQGKNTYEAKKLISQYWFGSE